MRLHWIVLGFALFLGGCGQQTSEKKQTDAELIAAQGICPITTKKLGSMGEPVKVMVQGQPVFLCCAACREEALADPDKTLATVEELKRK